MLTREEEHTLLREIQAGSEPAMMDLIEAFRPLLARQVRSRPSRGLEREDLMQAATAGIIDAAKRFDPDRGTRFSPYAASWVRWALQTAEAEAAAIPLPAQRYRQRHLVRSVAQRTEAETGTAPTAEWVAGATRVTPALARLFLQGQAVGSLEALPFEPAVETYQTNWHEHPRRLLAAVSARAWMTVGHKPSPAEVAAFAGVPMDVIFGALSSDVDDGLEIEAALSIDTSVNRHG
ncbi:MAG: sigma factor [Chloroflexota bacterium]